MIFSDHMPCKNSCAWVSGLLRSCYMNKFARLSALSKALLSTLSAEEASIIHYWNFEEELPEVPDEIGESGGTTGAEVTATTGPDDSGALFFPPAIQGGGAFDETGYVDLDPIVADVPQAFSMTYWVSLEVDNTTNPRGIFDFSGNGNQGVQSLFIQNGANADKMAFRVDGTNGLNSAAVTFADVPEDESWFFVAATFDPSGDLEVHVNGFGIDASVSAAGTGDVTWDIDQYLGAFNVQPSNAANVNRGLNGSLDDVAIYSGILTPEEIEGLFDGTLKPTDIGSGGTGPGELEVASFDFDPNLGQSTLVFNSVDGNNYSVFGGTDLSSVETWEEISTTEIVGNGDLVTFIHTPETPDETYFYVVRKDPS